MRWLLKTQKYLYLLFLGIFFLLFSTLIFAAAEPIGQVVWVKGRVEVVSVDNQSHDLARGGYVYEKDTLKSDETGTGQLVFSDGSLLTIRAKTVMKLSEYHYVKEGAPTQNKYVVDVIKGGFRTITGAIPKSHPEGYQIKTPVATIGVRGTIASVFVANNGATSTEVTQGSIIFTNLEGQSTILTADTHKAIAEINARNATPVILTERPPEFQTELRIEKAVMQVTPPPSQGPPSAGPPGGNAPTPEKPVDTGTSPPASGSEKVETTPTSGTKTEKGVVSGFCIK